MNKAYKTDVPTLKLLDTLRGDFKNLVAERTELNERFIEISEKVNTLTNKINNLDVWARERFEIDKDCEILSIPSEHICEYKTGLGIIFFKFIKLNGEIFTITKADWIRLQN